MDEGDARGRPTEILEALPDGVGLYDAEGQLVIFNAEYGEGILSDVVRPAVRFEDIVRAAIDRKLLPVPGGHVEAYVRSLLEERRAGDTESVVRISDDRWMLSRTRRTTTGGLLCVRSDFTQVVRSQRERLGQESGKNEALRTEIEQRRRIEQELRTSEARHRVLCEYALDEQAEALFGYAREELLGRLPEILVPERSRGTHVALRQEATSRAVRHQMGSGRRVHALRKDGSEVPVDGGHIWLESASGAGSTFCFNLPG